MTTTRTPRSSWISSIAYHRGFLVLFTRHDSTSRGAALFYAGVPSWVPGLLVAGTARRSVGRAYNKLVKGKGYAGQTISDARVLKELREMMKATTAKAAMKRRTA